jgi:glycosyltransferase 2 family protein
MRRILKPQYLIALAFIPLLVWALRDLPFQEIGTTLQRLNPLQLLALFTLNAFIFLLFSSRWWLILLAQGYRLPYLALAGYRLSAFSVSYFTPGTQFGGEPLQVHWLQDRHAVPGPQALAAVTLDKLFEVMANFTFLALGLLVAFKDSQLAGNLGPAALVLIAILLALPLAYLLALWSGRFPLTALAARLPRRLLERTGLQKSVPWFTDSEQHIHVLIRHKPLTILSVLVLSGLVWALLLAEYWLSLTLLGVHADLIQTIAALTAARIAFLTPLPGGAGALEASQVLAMQALGIHPAVGISLSLLIRARDLSFGLVGLLWAAMLSRSHQRGAAVPAQACD